MVLCAALYTGLLSLVDRQPTAYLDDISSLFPQLDSAGPTTELSPRGIRLTFAGYNDV
jgi:hypothetical protein